jgi:hypothetical protein
MGEIIEGKWKKHGHVDEHRKQWDSLIELIKELNGSIMQETPDVPLMNDGLQVDLDQLSIGYLVRWAMLQAQKPTHEHGENNEVIIRPRRDPSNGGHNKKGVDGTIP